MLREPPAQHSVAWNEVELKVKFNDGPAGDACKEEKGLNVCVFCETPPILEQ